MLMLFLLLMMLLLMLMMMMMMSEMMKTFEGGKLFKHRLRGRDLSLEPQSKSVGAHFGHWLTEI